MEQYIDSHAHLDGTEYDADRAEVLARAQAAGVVAVVNPGTDMASSARAIALATEYPMLHAAAGVHPHEAEKWNEQVDAQFRTWAKEKKIVAIGETGLDYYRNLAPREAQLAAFRAQAAIAKEFDLPLIIHVRDEIGSLGIFSDVFEVVRAHVGVRGVIHSFSGGFAQAKMFTDIGFLISFSGLITFPKVATTMDNALEMIDLDAVLIETDAPFLTPVPNRGKRNEPAYVVECARAIATAKKLSLADVAHATTRNAQDLFRLAPNA